MKKRIAIICLVLFVSVVAVSCSHKTCPAYRGSLSENITVNE